MRERPTRFPNSAWDIFLALRAAESFTPNREFTEESGFSTEPPNQSMGKYAKLSSGKMEMIIKTFHYENYKYSYSCKDSYT
jgi:hypothetical protein